MGETGRKFIDCREYPTDNKCTLAISGSESDVLEAAVSHAVAKHGHQDTPEFRTQLKSMLKDAR